MKKITMYQAHDGVMYETAEAAYQADRRASLQGWLDDADTDWRNVQISELLDNVLAWVDVHYKHRAEE
jgi:hypothetical protein